MISFRLKKRVQLLNTILLFISQLEIYIEFLSLSLPQIVKEASKNVLYQDLDFIITCDSYLNGSLDFPQAWLMSVSESKLPFNKQEKEKLIQLFSVLGTSDIDGQKQMLSLYKGYFQQYCDEAAENQKKYGNLSVVCGVFMGCLLFVLLI